MSQEDSRHHTRDSLNDADIKRNISIYRRKVNYRDMATAPEILQSHVCPQVCIHTQVYYTPEIRKVCVHLKALKPEVTLGMIHLIRSFCTSGK